MVPISCHEITRSHTAYSTSLKCETNIYKYVCRGEREIGRQRESERTRERVREIERDLERSRQKERE